MSERQPTIWIYRVLPIGVALILILIPFHAILTVWLSQFVGHYTLLRLWKEILLVSLSLGAAYILVRDDALRRRLIGSWLVRLIALYISAELLWGVIAHLRHQVSSVALGYAWVSDLRYFIFFVVVWVIAAAAPRLYYAWPKLVFWPAAIVVLFGLVQYFFLPYDFLRHLGYSASTIFPYEDINHNMHYIRAMATLRGANPLGAYLALIVSLLLVLRRQWRKWWYIPLLVASLTVLVLSFSRAAWLGLAASAAFLLWLQVHSRYGRRLVFATGIGGIIIAFGLGVLLRYDATFQNIVFHTETHSAIKTTSDQGHASALIGGLHDVVREPLGRGPGTAGPASVYNTGHPGRIAENYFIQIAQETGWLGLALFLGINSLTAWALWQRRSDHLALGLLAAFLAVSIANCFSHAWADDTLAYIWWGLAGTVIAGQGGHRDPVLTGLGNGARQRAVERTFRRGHA